LGDPGAHPSSPACLFGEYHGPAVVSRWFATETAPRLEHDGFVQRRNNPMISALASVLKCKLKPTTAADGFGGHVELVGLHREHSEQLPVRMVALGWTRAAIARLAEISTCLQSALGQLASRAARTLGKFAHICRDVHDKPVPEARASRRVRAVAGDGKALCRAGRARPLEMRHLVGAACRLFSLEDFVERHSLAHEMMRGRAQDE